MFCSQAIACASFLLLFLPILWHRGSGNSSIMLLTQDFRDHFDIHETLLDMKRMAGVSVCVFCVVHCSEVTTECHVTGACKANQFVWFIVA